MSYRIPYNLLPNLGTLQEDDIVPGLRPAFEEGSMTVGDLKSYISPAKVYRATMTQSGTDDPEVNTIFENTIGEIVWTYSGANGNYYGTLIDGFTGNLPEQSNVFFNKSVSYNAFYYRVSKADSNTILLITLDETINEINNLLKETFIEILYYPAAL